MMPNKRQQLIRPVGQRVIRVSRSDERLSEINQWIDWAAEGLARELFAQINR